jgi:hypothetical protein
LLGARFETYEPFISLIFHFFFGPRQTADTESTDTGARLYELFREKLASLSYLIMDKVITSVTFASDGNQPSRVTAEQAQTRGLRVK